MKMQFLFMLVIAFGLSVALAQTPETVILRFKTDYPAASTVEWKVDADRYKVTFTDQHNLHHMLIYDKDGKVYGRESELAEASVPASINEYFIKNFPNEKGARVWLTENEAGIKSYYTPIDDAVLFFDKDGKFVRRDARTPHVMQPN
ncbi:MAG: PepSY-like domain-containing protein [Chitinophagales bacterium]